jgi:metallo-beta-lactamase family protein
MQIRFCGAAQTVTGSAHLLSLNNGFKILLDCGLYQGSEEEMKNFNETWLFDPAEIDLVVLSHAHIDHSARLPKLVKDGFKGDIISTHATRSLCNIMLLDSAKIQEYEAEYHNSKELKKSGKAQLIEPLYKSADVIDTMRRFSGLPYDRWEPIHPNVELQYRDAGHILGSANITLRIKENGQERLIGFTGDIGRPDRPILRDPQQMPECDYLICESTYGDRLHEGKPEETERFLEIIKKTCIERKGKLIIPAFSVGRTQELVYMLDKLETAGRLPQIPVYVDSPLAVNATMIFGSHPECFDQELSEYMLLDDNPFGFNDLTYVRSVELSKSLNNSQQPAIIISASGMMNAGRVRHHAANNLSDPKNTFLIVGYCARGTLGSILLDGVKEVKLFGNQVPVRAEIIRMGSFSAHADQKEMLNFISNQHNANEIFLVHGEREAQRTFAREIRDSMQTKVHVPDLNSLYHLK